MRNVISSSFAISAQKEVVANGIDSITYFRMFTMGFESPSVGDSGWIPSSASDYPDETGLSKTNRYLWQKKVTSFTLGSEPDVEISLVAQFDSSPCANLLEDTAFRDDNEMGAWDIHEGRSFIESSMPQRAWECTSVPASLFTEVLQQKVFDSTLKKLKPNTWYTLSFWGAMSNCIDLIDLSDMSALTNDSNPGYINHIDSVWLKPGQRITVKARGRVASENVCMRVSAWSLNGTVMCDVASLNIHDTWFTEKSFQVVNFRGTSQLFYIRAQCYLMENGFPGNTLNSIPSSSNRIYLSRLSIDRGARLTTSLPREGDRQSVAHDPASPWYVNGRKYSGPAFHAESDGFHGTEISFADDGRVDWYLSPTPRRCSLTFKTHSSFSGIDNADWIKVLFSLDSFAHDGWVSMPKLEENTIATEWMEASEDRYAADFQHIYMGDFTPGSVYMYEQGVRHVVLAQESADTINKTYFRLKKRTSGGRVCTMQPYLDSVWWEKANQLRFVASDLLLARETFTDRLVVGRVESKHFSIDELGNARFGGEIIARYANGNPRITINEDGEGWLRYYYDNGQIMREEFTDYENGNVCGVGYRLYDREGNLKATYGWDGRSKTLTTGYWSISSSPILSGLPSGPDDWNLDSKGFSGSLLTNPSYSPSATGYASRYIDKSGSTNSEILNYYWNNSSSSANPSTMTCSKSTFYAVDSTGVAVSSESEWYRAGENRWFRSVTLYYQGARYATKWVIYNRTSIVGYSPIDPNIIRPDSPTSPSLQT